MSEPSTPIEELSEPPFQFGIGSLLILQAVVAVFFAMLMTAGIFAVLVLFIALLVYCMIRPKPENVAMKRAVVDVCGGLILPALCFIYDPFVLHLVGSGRGFLVFAVLLPMLCLATWLIWGRWLVRFGGLFAGVLGVGYAASFVIGILLLPATFFGTIFLLIGLLGFVPFLTARVLRRNASESYRRCKKAFGGTRSVRLSLVGVVVAIGVPVLLTACFGEALDEIVKKTLGQPWPQVWPECWIDPYLRRSLQ